MNDLLLMDSLPGREIKRQATARDGFWNRVLRKRKKAIAAWDAKRAQEAREGTAERIAKVGQRDFRRHIEALSAAIGGIVPAGWPLSWKSGLPAPRIRGRGRRIAAKPSMQEQDETNAQMQPGHCAWSRPGDLMRFNRADQQALKRQVKDDHADLQKFKADAIKEHYKKEIE
jgi:hypothetical protein